MLTSMLKQLRQRLNQNPIKNQKGQGATEYILLVAVVVGIVVLFGPTIKNRLNGATDKIGRNIDQTIDESTGP